MERLVLGQVVSSRVGRDRNKYYIVVRIQDDSFIEVADGSTRKVGHPKVKNRKHVVVHDFVDDYIVQTVGKQEKITNEQVRHGLQRFLELGDQGREEGSTVNGKR